MFTWDKLFYVSRQDQIVAFQLSAIKAKALYGLLWNNNVHTTLVISNMLTQEPQLQSHQLFQCAQSCELHSPSILIQFNGLRETDALQKIVKKSCFFLKGSKVHLTEQVLK